MTPHHFNMRGAAEIVEIFLNDPTADYHAIIGEMAHLPRDQAKTVNFGLAYGEGVNTLCTNLGLGTKEGMRLLSDYHDCLPFMRRLLDHWKRKVERGVEACSARSTKTATRCASIVAHVVWSHPPFQQVRNLARRQEHPAPALGAWRPARLHLRRAQRENSGQRRRYFKAAMCDLWASGVCDVFGPPLITLHDELDWSAPNTKAGREALAEIKNIMETVVDISVKLTVDSKTGPNWGCK